MTDNRHPLAGGQRARRVEAAVQLEWRYVVQRRLGRRRAMWIAAGCAVFAATIALGLHRHVEAPAAGVSASRASYGSRLAAHEAGRPRRGDREELSPPRGLPRHMVIRYSLETR